MTKGIIYQLQVALSTLDWTHSMWTPIEEVFIPSLGICFNSKGYAFKTDKSRYKKHKPDKNMPRQPNPKKLREVNLSEDDIIKITGFVNNRATVNEIAKKLFNVEPYEDDENGKD